MRLDRRLKAAHASLSWRQVRDAIEKGHVIVDGRVRKDPGLDVSDAAIVTLDRNRPAARPVRAPFVILHEDDHVLVIDKPAGLLSIPSAPGAGALEDTVLRRVRDYMERKRGRAGYVGMLHRLDRDTSGSLAVALSKEAHAAGRELFKAHRFERRYLALVRGVPDPPRGTITARISSGYRAGRRTLVDDRAPGLDSATDYEVRERLNGAALLELTLHTGRQHQIRLHLEKLGHPLLGETVYDGRGAGGDKASTAGSRRPEKRTMLHAWTLAFPHPITGARISVEAPPPADFLAARRGRSAIMRA